MSDTFAMKNVPSSVKPITPLGGEQRSLRAQVPFAVATEAVAPLPY